MATMCTLCRRTLLIGERYRLWLAPSGIGERPVCRLCEPRALVGGWRRPESPDVPERHDLIWHARKVA